MNLEQLFEEMVDEIRATNGIALKDIPAIDLYMDQLTTFMDEHLRARSRKPEEDKVLTKTMINNYAKNDLLPPPVRKKYSKDHLILLIFIYYLKNLLSISDIETLLAMVREYFHVSDTQDVTLSSIYETMADLNIAAKPTLEAELKQMKEKAEETFSSVPGEEGEKLRVFTYLILMAYDVYMKKLLIEKAVDELFTPDAKKKKTKEKKEKKDKKGEDTNH